MRNLTRILLAAVVAPCLLAPSMAEAGSVYQFAFDQSTYQADPGGQVQVNVYLQERVSDGTASVLATEGLIGAGVRVAFDLSPLPSDPARIGKLGDISLNDGPGAFSGGFQSTGLAAGSYAQLTETVDLFSPAVTATDLGGGLYQILLGTFRFTTGSIAGQTTLIEALDIPGSSDVITGSGSTLDPLIAPGRAGIWVEVGTSAVPEPSSLLGLTIGMICAGGYAVARRRDRAGT